VVRWKQYGFPGVTATGLEKVKLFQPGTISPLVSATESSAAPNWSVSLSVRTMSDMDAEVWMNTSTYGTDSPVGVKVWAHCLS